jgi:hypothetical protein
VYVLPISFGIRGIIDIILLYLLHTQEKKKAKATLSFNADEDEEES